MAVEIVVAENNIPEAQRLSAEAARKALEEIGMVAETFAKEYCPVDTGRLMNSITHTTTQESAIISTNVEYAGYVEMGTSKMRAQPYLKPAVADHMGEYRQIVTYYLTNG